MFPFLFVFFLLLFLISCEQETTETSDAADDDALAGKSADVKLGQGGTPMVGKDTLF